MPYDLILSNHCHSFGIPHLLLCPKIWIIRTSSCHSFGISHMLLCPKIWIIRKSSCHEKILGITNVLFDCESWPMILLEKTNNNNYVIGLYMRWQVRSSRSNFIYTHTHTHTHRHHLNFSLIWYVTQVSKIFGQFFLLNGHPCEILVIILSKKGWQYGTYICMTLTLIAGAW